MNTHMCYHITLVIREIRQSKITEGVESGVLER